MKKLFFAFTVAFLLFLPCSKAQFDFRPGYLILNSGDTLHTEIGFRGDKLMALEVKYRDAEGKVQSYDPGEIKGYRMEDNRYFVSKRLEGRMYFAEFLVDGILDIYYLRGEDSDKYYAEKDGAPLTEIKFEEGIRKRKADNIEEKYKTTFHVGILKKMTEETPEIHNRIERMERPKHNNLVKVAEAYHDIVCTDGTECLTYYQKPPAFKVLAEIHAGRTELLRVDDDEVIQSYFAPGIILNVGLPRTHEKFALRLGALFVDGELIGSDRTIIKIPLQVQYLGTQGFFRPNIAYGLYTYGRGLQSGFGFAEGFTANFRAGCHLALSEKMFVSLGGEFEFLTHKLALFAKELNDPVSFNVGLGFVYGF